jgi:predicted phosphodiesterase
MRVGVCSDPHAYADRLEAVLDEMSAAGVAEKWCLGDLVGEGPDIAGVIRLVRQLDFVLAGNHDAWLLADRARTATATMLSASDRQWLSSLKPDGQRHGVTCWHGKPSAPILGFFDELGAASELYSLNRGTLGLVGHTHLPRAYLRSGTRVWAHSPVGQRSLLVSPGWVVVANPGAVAGNECDPAPWWLELDLDARSLCWHRLDISLSRAP